jgi:hypothetical protein
MKHDYEFILIIDFHGTESTPNFWPDFHGCRVL